MPVDPLLAAEKTLEAVIRSLAVEISQHPDPTTPGNIRPITDLAEKLTTLVNSQRALRDFRTWDREAQEFRPQP